MTHVYTVSGMTCNGCVASVKSNLLKHPDILAADIDLENEQASLTMARYISVPELQQTIGKGKYTINQSLNGHHQSIVASDDARSWLQTYKPILLVFLFITGVSLMTSFQDGVLQGMTFMNSFMAGFFIVFAFFKFLDLKGFSSSYAMYDVVATRIPVYGWVYPFIELGLGLAYLIGYSPFITNITTIAVMSVSSIGVVRSVLKDEKIKCACLGSVFNLPMSTITIIEDLLMVGMAVAALMV